MQYSYMIAPTKMRTRRRSMNLTLEKVAESTGLSVTAIHAIETGRNNTSQGNAAGIAKALDISIGSLFDVQRSYKAKGAA